MKKSFGNFVILTVAVGIIGVVLVEGANLIFGADKVFIFASLFAVASGLGVIVVQICKR